MKFIKNFSRTIGITALSAMTLFSACDEKLDIDPQQSIGSDQVYTTTQGVQTALIGAYERLQNGALYGTNLNLVSELMAASGTNIQWTGTFLGYRQLFSKNITAENSEASRTWIVAYNAINITNNIIANIDVVEDEDVRDRILGEALFIRGAVYFELVRLYGLPYNAGDPSANLGVPLVLEPTVSITESAKVSRASVAAVYAQALEDLTQAKSLLPETNGTRATTYTASAFLARVYLQQQKYSEALTEADRVIESAEYTLATNYANVFNNNSNIGEYVFAIQQNAQSNAGSANDGLATFYANINGQGRGDVDLAPAFLSMYPTGDDRLKIYYVDAEGVLRNGKYQDPFTNIPVVRLAEMYLIRAEANFRLNTSVGATPLADVNVIRQRAKLAPLTAVTLADILQERRRELALEGLALHDVKRLEGTVGNLSWDSPRLILPIPQREIDANPNLEQNSAYL